MRLFTNATIKLAGWYLIILMVVSLLFSVIIFQVARSEIASRLYILTDERQSSELGVYLSPDAARDQLRTATASLMANLGYINLVVLLAGGTGAYFLARQTLKPIEAAHEAQSRFVSNASHQFRTPLAIMKAETELVLRTPSAKKSDLRAALESNLEEIDHLSTLSSMLLELSQNEKAFGQTADQVELVSLVAAAIAAQDTEKRVTLTAPDTLIIYSYEAALREIIHILLDNALKHSPDGSIIAVNLSRSKQSTLLSVSNTGSAQDRRHLIHAFERFYRTHETAGYGLGLPLARQLVEALSGTISITSDKEGNIHTSVTLPQK